MLYGFASTEGGCWHYRAELPARALAAGGLSVALGADLALDPAGGPIGLTTRDVDERDAALVDDDGNVQAFAMVDDGWIEPDVLVLAGGYPAKLGPDAIAGAVAAGQRVVADCDDYPYLPAANPHYVAGAAERKIDALRAASAVTASTPGLVRYLASVGIDAQLCRNWIDRDRWRDVRIANVSRRLSASPRDELVVGYRGLLAGFHDADVRALRGEWPRRGVRYRHAGADPRARRSFAQLADVDAQLVDEQPAVAFEHYGPALAGVDVAVIPYAANPFSSSKSNIAALEWSAAGVPWWSTGNREVFALDPAHADLRPGALEDELRRLRDPDARGVLVAAQWDALDVWVRDVANVDAWRAVLAAVAARA